MLSLLYSLTAFAAATSAVAATAEITPAATTKPKPNIVLILTDDQDKGTLAQARWLPRIHKYLVDEGVYYENFFAPVSVCCPSRVSLLRAQYAHNHNITFVSPPWGGWDVFNKYGYVQHTLPDFLQHAGYNTYYTGKFMNDHNENNCESLPVSGFNSSDILVDPYTYDYWSPGFSRDNGPVKVHKGEYSTDLVKEKALDYLDTALDEDRPFFLGIAPIACHSWLSKIDTKLEHIQADIPASHPRHARLFPTEQLPRTESWNPEEPQGVSWVRTLPRLNSTQEAYLDEFFRGRLRALQVVDEIVEDVVKKLEDAGQLDNTYIFYTADNGYALGTHRRQPGKTLGYEEDIHVPLIVRGPGVKKGVVDSLSSYGMVDLSRTILDVAEAATDYHNDGVKINLHQDSHADAVGVASHQLARHSISEYWVLGVEEGIYGGTLRANNTYRTLRVHDTHEGETTTYSYSVWCTGERELYDLEEDPHQVRNLLAPLNSEGPFAPFDAIADSDANADADADADATSTSSVLPKALQRVLNRLDALLLVLKACAGQTCHQPYKEIFPHLTDSAGEIFKFSQTLDPRFDAYFASLPKVMFSQCALGYQTRLEKPDWKSEWAFRPSASASTSRFVLQGGL